MEPLTSNLGWEHRQVDVLMVSDFRFPGGTSHSVAEEIAGPRRRSADRPVWKVEAYSGRTGKCRRQWQQKFT